MSITPYLDELDADPETKRVLAVALEMTRVSLGLTDDLADGITYRPPYTISEERSRKYPREISRGSGIYAAVNCLTFPAHALCFPPSFCLRLLISALASRNSAVSKPSVNWS